MRYRPLEEERLEEGSPLDDESLEVEDEPEDEEPFGVTSMRFTFVRSSLAKLARTSSPSCKSLKDAFWPSRRISVLGSSFSLRSPCSSIVFSSASSLEIVPDIASDIAAVVSPLVEVDEAASSRVDLLVCVVGPPPVLGVF